MRYEFTAEYIEIDPTATEYRLLRNAIKKRLICAASGGLRLEQPEAWKLTEFLAKSVEAPRIIRASLCDLPYFTEALNTALPDLDTAGMQIVQEMIGGLTIATDGFELLRNQVAAPDYVPEGL